MSVTVEGTATTDLTGEITALQSRDILYAVDMSAAVASRSKKLLIGTLFNSVVCCNNVVVCSDNNVITT